MASASAPAAVEFGTDELSAIDLSDAAAADAPSEADASASVSVTIKRSQFFPEGKPRLDSATSLWRAAEHGDIGRLKMLLDAGHDVNAMCEDPGWRHKTPLSAAVDGNEPLAVRLLLRRGANPDLRDGDGDRYPLHWASSFGDHDECAELLVQAGASLDARDAHGQTPLEFARRPFVGALGVVLGRGVELGRPKVEAVLSGAAAREATDGPRPTWSAEHAARALRHEFWKAAASGDHKVLERCLARYRQPVDQPRPASKSRLSALAIASYNGQLRAMASLLRHGADPNLAEAEGGFTPLHFCVHDADRSAATRVLLEARANPLKPKHDGLTPLDVARKNGCEESGALLASAVARIDAAEALEVLIRNVEGNWLIGRTTSAQLAAAIDRAAKTDVDATVLIRATEMKTALCAQEEAADGARQDAPTWAARRGWAGGLSDASSWAHDALSKLVGAVSGASTDPEEAGAPSGLQQAYAVVVMPHSAKFANLNRKLIDVPNVGQAVGEVLLVPSTCVPDYAVMLSMATTHHMKLRHHQFALVRNLDCFMSRIVSVCYGFTDSYGRCVFSSCNKSLGLANPCLPSDYRRSQYVALNWAKWPLFIDSLRVARSALWLEADVVIHRNPWEVLLSTPQLQRTVFDAVRYQWESPPCSVPELVTSSAVACVKSGWPSPHPEPLNCGQLLLNSLEFALEVWASRPAVFKNGAMSQQGYANLIKGNYSHSGLPLNFFNLCWKAQRYVKIVDQCELVTFHATCEMVAKTKRLSMNTSVNSAAKHSCALSQQKTLTKAQLGAFATRVTQPTRLTVIRVRDSLD